MGKNVAEVFPPGEFLKEELEARDWSQVELAEIMGRPSRVVSEVIAGKRAITPETAVALGEALGTGAEFWMNLESQYQLSKVRSEPNTISRRAKLYNMFPVREMIKRGWVEASSNLDLLESQFSNYFGISSLDEKPAFPHAARKTSYDDVSIQQIAWLIRAGKIASAVSVDKFTQSKLTGAMTELRDCIEFVDSIRQVPALLARAGIRLVIVEALASSKIDGACFWLAKDAPVVALSLRFDRVDNFWHTLLHELDHIAHGEGQTSPIVEVDMLSDDADLPSIEKRANEAAAEFSIPKIELEGFIARVNPLFTDQKILGFSKRLRVHPGIVVGQLQNRKLIPWQFHRKYLEKVREYVVGAALTDGFGNLLPANL
ncbi:HigA family addiction module antitoxin [Burkholderia orbicola]|uniref:HigA family addiction module antitoxin n=1 Tax=Burkholderia orbicola TaxID=2978683 RepID=UPI00264AA344|nr:HigA family addiction module antitoxin [Burkholderia orbicola]MDN7506625.1 HigA family addiction module antitoxin [Burkholderia orbicola]